MAPRFEKTEGFAGLLLLDFDALLDENKVINDLTLDVRFLAPLLPCESLLVSTTALSSIDDRGARCLIVCCPS